MQRVAIIGSEQTRHERRKADQRVEDMIYETVRALLDKTGLDIKDVDVVIGAGDDVLDGRSISNAFTAEYAGAFLKEESKVEDDGAFAAAYAMMRIASGACDTALIYAYSKSSDSSPQHYSGLIADPFYLRPLGIEAITAAALQANYYFQKRGIGEEDAALVAVKNRKNALKNPHAQLKGEFTVADVLRSAVIASPIKRLDCSPITDGCCAMLLASERSVKRFNLKAAWIRGVGFSSDEFYIGCRDLADARSARIAAERAYKMAGIADPKSEIDVAEIHEPFSFQELMLYEALGFCEAGRARELISSGETCIDGSLPVNPSGGALSANPIFAAGLIRLAEAALQVTQQAGDRGVLAKTALAHATSGLCLQSNIVYIVSSKPE
jgi:acetyl-CoA C-acetyltransferase